MISKHSMTRMLLSGLLSGLVSAPLLAFPSGAMAQTIAGGGKGGSGAVTLAAPDSKNAKEKQRLQARSEARYPEIRRNKSEGKIGENTAGYLEAVKKEYLGDDALRQLIDDENADRKALYALIADEDGTDAALVAKRAAKRNIERARPGEYVKQEGQWKRK